MGRLERAVEFDEIRAEPICLEDLKSSLECYYREKGTSDKRVSAEASQTVRAVGRFVKKYKPDWVIEEKIGNDNFVTLHKRCVEMLVGSENIGKFERYIKIVANEIDGSNHLLRRDRNLGFGVDRFEAVQSAIFEMFGRASSDDY